MLRIRELVGAALEHPFFAIGALGAGIAAVSGGAEIIDLTLQTEAIPDAAAGMGILGGVALMGVGAIGLNRP